MLDPYRSAFDPKFVGASGGAMDAPPHRYLFNCYMYEYHTMQLGLLLSGLVRFGASHTGEILPHETICSWTRSFGWSRRERSQDCGIRHCQSSCCFGGVNGVRRQTWIVRMMKILVRMLASLLH